VGDQVGDPELAPPQLPPEGVGRADVLHWAAQDAAHVRGEWGLLGVWGRRCGRVLWGRRWRGLPAVLGAGPVGLLGLGRAVVGARAGGAAAHGGGGWCRSVLAAAVGGGGWEWEGRRRRRGLGLGGVECEGRRRRRPWICLCPPLLFPFGAYGLVSCERVDGSSEASRLVSRAPSVRPSAVAGRQADSCRAMRVGGRRGDDGGGRMDG
jgi:hypothetical protein